jgi:hypothetical protein
MSATTVTVTKKTETKPRIKKVKPVETPVETPVSVTQPPAEVDAEAPIKEKKERPPRLPEKFGKFIQFAYWFMKKYNSETPKVDETEFLNAIAFYGTVDEQTSFVESFVADAKENKKEIRKNIVAHKKAAMPKKERKPREKKPKLDADGNEIPPKEKKPKGKKATKEVGNTQDELINELVRRANSTDVPAEVADQVAAEVAAEEKKPTKSSAKPKAKKDDKPKKDDKSKKDDKPKETKTKETKTKKTKDTKTKDEPQTETNQEQEQEQDTDVQLIEINGKTYYVDDQDVLYDVDSQEELGTLDRNTMTTAFL